MDGQTDVPVRKSDSASSFSTFNISTSAGSMVTVVSHVTLLMRRVSLLCIVIPNVCSFPYMSSRRFSGSVGCSSGSKFTTSTSRQSSSRFNTVSGPPKETKPDYENIHGPLGKSMDNIFMRIFREQLAKHLEFDSNLPKDDYMSIMELAGAMNARMSDRRQVQQTAQAVLRSMFPGWMPGSYAILFSKPFPKFSARMNAWATRMAGTWLMGECELNDVPVVDDGTVGYQQGLLVKRCRFLEESGCASVCVNSCKIPTQNFFLQDMGLPLTMEPNYETFECQFSFGLTPNAAQELQAKNTPCLARCPTAGGMRQWHSASSVVSNSRRDAAADVVPSSEALTKCQLMEKSNRIEVNSSEQILQQ